MKKIIYLILLPLLLFSCRDDSTNPSTDQRFKKVYNIIITLENSQIAGKLGVAKQNECSEIENISFIAYPNPSIQYITIALNALDTYNLELFIETALADADFINSYNLIYTHKSNKLVNHKNYYIKSVFKGKVSKGDNSIKLDISQFDAGVYYLSYKDEEGNQICFPIAIQKINEKLL